MRKQKSLVLLLIFAIISASAECLCRKEKGKTEQKNGNSKRWKDSKNQTAKQQKEGEVDSHFRQEKCDA